MKKLISIDQYNRDYNTCRLTYLHCLYFCKSIKKDFNKYNFSLIFSVTSNNRINVMITDRQEKKLYCGISSKNIDDVVSFLRKNLEKIKGGMK